MQDANWNVTSNLNSAGIVEERYGYHPYGTAFVLTSDLAPRSSSDFASDRGFATYIQDVETGLLCVRRRNYVTVLGTWVQREPLGYSKEDGFNLYQYCQSCPASAGDPSGQNVLFCIPIGKLSKPEAIGGLTLGGTSDLAPQVPVEYIVCKKVLQAVCACERSVWRTTWCIGLWRYKEVVSVPGTIEVVGRAHVRGKMDGEQITPWDQLDFPADAISFLTGGSPEFRFTKILVEPEKARQACNSPGVKWDKPRWHVPGCA